jgi:predicted DNA repair protein MutK
MASSLFALIDDIATLLDDVALLTKIAAQKTAGVLGDDLALNAQQVSGVAADRELPVVWAVGKGSMVNKLILVPAALILSLTLPWVITPLLMLGGAYLCYEGFEKLAHSFVHRKSDPDDLSDELMQALADPTVDLVELEKDKIKGAIRTDFVLSAEIIAITLGTVQNSPWGTQLAVLSGVAIVMTVGVYGLVAGIVKIDDLGLYMSRLPVKGSRWKQTLGLWLLDMAPWLMKTLSVVGTAAMFLVGGGILSHGLPFVHHAVLAMTEGFVAGAGAAGAVLGPVVTLSLNALVGVAAGALVLLLVAAVQRLLGLFKRA